MDKENNKLDKKYLRIFEGEGLYLGSEHEAVVEDLTVEFLVAGTGGKPVGWKKVSFSIRDKTKDE